MSDDKICTHVRRSRDDGGRDVEESFGGRDVEESFDPEESGPAALTCGFRERDFDRPR